MNMRGDSEASRTYCEVLKWCVFGCTCRELEQNAVLLQIVL